jgi:ABC-type dipeptide/oligopeptide/nickel transport system permease subunit
MTLLFPDDDNTEKTDAKTILNANVAWKTFVSGAVAGMISRTCTAPFDRLKTVMQVRDIFNNFPALFFFLSLSL